MINFYDLIPKDLCNKVHNPNYDLHNIDIPFRMIVVAPSGSGKTNFVVNLIALFSKVRKKKKLTKLEQEMKRMGYELEDEEGTFSDIHIITRNKDEPLYNYLERMSPDIKITEGMETIPNLDEFNKNENHLVVFDDLVLEKNLRPITEYYIRARKLNVSVIFLSQSYYTIPKNIRINCNYIVILKLSGKRDIKLILSEFTLGVDMKTLIEMYEISTNKKFGTFIINVNAPPECMFRNGFLNYF